MMYSQQSFIFINAEEDAQQYILPPNHTALLMCRQKPIFYIKSTDSLGQPTLDRYSFKKEPPQTTLPDNVVTIEQFNAFKDEIKSLLTPTPQQTQTQEVTANVNESTK